MGPLEYLRYSTLVPFADPADLIAQERYLVLTSLITKQGRQSEARFAAPAGQTAQERRLTLRVLPLKQGR